MEVALDPGRLFIEVALEYVFSLFKVSDVSMFLKGHAMCLNISVTMPSIMGDVL